MSNASILMITSQYRTFGGVETVMNNLCLGLDKLGYETSIGAFSFSNNPPEKIKKLKLQKIRNLPSNNKENDFDIFHSHQPRMNYYSLFAKKPFLFHYHGANGFIQRLNIKLAFLLCHNHISKVISVSKAASSQFRNIVGQISTEVVYNAVDTKFFHPNLQGIFKKGDPQLLFVGNLYPTKNVMKIIEMMPNLLEEYPEAHLQIIGNGIDEKKLNNLINEKNLKNNVEILGQLSENEKRLRYSSCDIYVSASKFETFDLPSVEAMACGKPVVLSNIPPHQEIVNLSKAGKIFSLSSKNDFIKKIQEVYEDQQNYVSPARNFAENNNWQNACNALDKIYKELLI